MSQSKPFLCDSCPGRGNPAVDPEVIGSCPRYKIDSFLQTRRYRIECPEDYESNEEMAEMSASCLRYFDYETDDFYEETGDVTSATIGIECAERFLGGLCAKSLAQILDESQID